MRDCRNYAYHGTVKYASILLFSSSQNSSDDELLNIHLLIGGRKTSENGIPRNDMQENRVHSETLDFQSFAQHRAAGKTKDEQIPQFPPTLKVTGSTPAGRTGENSRKCKASGDF